MYQNPYTPFMGSQMAMNPYQGMTPAAQAPQMQVTKVNGEGGANAFSMGPNSSAILLDASGTMIWAVTTDGAGYKTVCPYDISPHKSQAAINYESLENRIKRLEEMIDDGHSEADQRGRHEGKSDAGES
jgi:uncharacterized protein GlcG (DUF336 family)